MKKDTRECINELDKHLDSLIEKHEHDSPLAIVYLVKNIDKLKYIVSGTPINRRHKIIVDYLKHEFNYIPMKDINNILYRNGIWSYSVLENFALIAPALLIGYYIGLHVDISSFVALFGYFIIGLLLYAVLSASLFYFFNTTVKTYRLSKHYRNKKVPKDINLNDK